MSVTLRLFVTVRFGSYAWRLLRRSLSFEAAHVLERALVHSRLDYCNAVLANAPQMLVLVLPSSPFCALLLGLY